MDVQTILSGQNIQLHKYNYGYLRRLASEGKLSLSALTELFTSLGMSPIISDLTNLSTYSNWSKVSDKSGFSIWKHAISDFEDNDNNLLYAGISDNVRNISVPHMYEYKGTALAESADYFDYIYTDDSGFSSNLGGAAGDLSVEAGTNSLFTDSQDLYVGDSAVFSGFFANLSIFGAGLAGYWTVEYWNGSAWTEITELMQLDDSTSNFTKSQRVYFDSSLLSGWATTTVNSQSAYWIKISATDGTRFPSAYQIIPSMDVTTLLHLTKDDIDNKAFGWCYYNGYVYVPILNAGQSAREGITWITDSSTVTNQQRFFELYNSIYVQYFLSSHPEDVSNRSGSATLDGTSGVVITHNLGHQDYTVCCSVIGTTARSLSVVKADNTATIYSTSGVTDTVDYIIRLN